MATDKPSSFSAVRTIKTLLQIGMVLAWLGLLLGALGMLHWAFDLCSHFFVQFTAIAILGAIALFGAVRKSIAFAALVASLLLLPAALGTYLPQSSKRGTQGKGMRVVSCNVLTSNQNKSSVLDFLKQSEADLILLMEVDGRWSEAIRTLESIYPFQLHEPREDNFGIALLSKHPWKDAKRIEFGDAEIPSIEAFFEFNEKQLYFIGTHPLPPTGPEYSRSRNMHFVQLANRIREADHALPTVVIGDLNCTPWSPYFRKLLAESQLRDSRNGFGNQPSWPTSAKISMFGTMRIPIDHALVSRDITVVNRRVGPFVGSDHFPIIVDLGL